MFIIPFGGGIPAGVLAARAAGLGFAVTSALYLFSDVLLALVFEPLMLLVIALGRRRPFFARLAWAFRTATLQLTAHYRGAGPLGLVVVAFGVDPMTGRAAAAAAGHGFFSGWAIAITGDMFYFWVVMASTLQLNAWIKDPDVTMWVILACMMLLPFAVRRARAAFRRATAGAPAQ